MIGNDGRRATLTSMALAAVGLMVLASFMFPLTSAEDASEPLWQEGEGWAFGTEVDLGTLFDYGYTNMTEYLLANENLTEDEIFQDIFGEDPFIADVSVEEIGIDGTAAAWIAFEVETVDEERYVLTVDGAVMVDGHVDLLMSANMTEECVYDYYGNTSYMENLTKSRRSVGGGVDVSFAAVAHMALALDRDTLALEEIDADLGASMILGLNLTGIPAITGVDMVSDNVTLEYRDYDVSGEFEFNAMMNAGFEPALDIFDLPLNMTEGPWNATSDMTLKLGVDGSFELDDLADLVEIDSYPWDRIGLRLDQLGLFAGGYTQMTIPIEAEVYCDDVYNDTYMFGGEEVNATAYWLDLTLWPDSYASEEMEIPYVPDLNYLIDELGGNELQGAIEENVLNQTVANNLWGNETWWGETKFWDICNATGINTTFVVSPSYAKARIADIAGYEVEVAKDVRGRTAPEAPQNLTAASGDASATLSWDAPSFDGYSPVTNYTVYRGTDPYSLSPVATVAGTAYNDNGLENGVTYNYRVRANNLIGEGPASEAAVATPTSVPSAPQDLTAMAGDGEVRLTWNPPAENGGAAIVGYEVWRGDSPTAEKALLASLGPSQIAYLDEDVVNGGNYSYVVVALNSQGSSPISGSVSASPTDVTAPSDPEQVMAEADDDKVVLSWEAPEDDGNSEVTAYKVYRGTSTDDMELVATLDANTTTYTDEDAEEGVTYVYQVVAVNSAGESVGTSMLSTSLEESVGGGSQVWFYATIGLALVSVALIGLMVKGGALTRKP